MPRERFLLIIQLLYLSDNQLQPEQGQPEFDRLYKIRKLITNLSNNFKEYADPEKVMAVHEQVIPRQLGMKQYKQKLAQLGIKVYSLVGQSGYVYSFFISGDNLNDLQPEDGVGVSGQIVLKLVLDLPAPVGTHLFFDNFFSSPSLLLKLREIGMPAASMIKANQTDKCPLKTLLQLRKEGRGSVDFYLTTEGILLLRWYDNHDVTLGSNYYSVAPITPVERWDKKNKKKVTVPCPHMVKCYNLGMGGIDRFDHLMAFYRISTKSSKWYKHVLYHFINLSLINSFILYKLDKEMPLF